MRRFSKYLAATLAACGIAGAGAAGASAATISLSASPTTVAAGGGQIQLTATGQATRAGSVFIYAQPIGVPCAATGEGERNNSTIVLVQERQNLGAGERFSESGTLFAEPGSGSYRACAYVGDFNDTIAPDARAEIVVCRAGLLQVGNTCTSAVTPPPPPGGQNTGGGGDTGGDDPDLESYVEIEAARRARGSVSVTLSWTARRQDRAVYLYAQPAGVSCYRTGEGERNNARNRNIRRIVEVTNVRPGDGSRTVRVALASSRRTRLCAYLHGFNDVEPAHARDQLTVMRAR